ncbi:MAG: hypothetical protein JW822_02285 [Spirochaetales bacterium]|nr:hypothetical protein [Spirochaetales bacterium]
MKSNNKLFFWRTGFVGVALILSGIFFLLTNFSVIPPVGNAADRIIGILFFITGLVFAFFQGRGGGLFWFTIPAGVAFSFGSFTLAVGISEIFSFTSAAILGIGFGTTFLIVFLLQKAQWWALLPSGSLYGVSLWILMSSIQPQIGFHPIFLLLCIGASFLCIYFLSVQKLKMRFALYTGAIIFLCSVIYYFLILFFEYKLFWAIFLILLGIAIPILFIIINKKSTDEKKIII